MAIVTDTVAVQRFAMGLFGVQVGTVTMAQVDKQIDRTSLGATLNSYYTSAFGGQTTAAVAATLVANLGITGAGVAGAVAYVTGALNAAAPAARGEAVSSIINLFSGLTADATYGAAAQAWNANVDVAAAYTGAANTAFGSVIHHSLTAGMDNLFGSALADVFTADMAAGGNTLQSGDAINGGAGNDTLHAVLGQNGDSFAITAKTSSVESVIVQAQSREADSGDNNVAGNLDNPINMVKVDAGRMSGVNNWENNNSRADLLIEDVRIADNQITKDITITMRETDPGHVDFYVLFDQNSLRNASASTSQINLQVMDTRAVVDGQAPLLNSPYGGFKFTATDAKGASTVVTLQSDAIDAAQTYAELAAAFQVAADKQFGAGVVTVTVGSDFTVTDTTTAKSVTGKEIVIKTSSSFSFTTPAGSGWVAAGTVPANSGLHTNFSQGSTTNTDPVTSTIVLDDVGRGSTGGDLVVGGLSTGDTSSSKGVQRFDITVEDNSKLETIRSTNNTLREVSIVNGITTRVNNAYNDNVKDAGNLTVKGESGENGAVKAGTYGFEDVKLIDAATFKGKLDLTAVLSDKVTAKYMNLTDESPAAADADNVQFAYNLGTNNDTFKLDIDAANLHNAGTTTREDFVLSIKGGAGKDNITADIINGGAEDGAAAWYNNSKLNANLSIDGGAGDDTISTKGSGDWKITAGDGNDTVYSDNSGKKAVWVFNTTDQTAAGTTAVQALAEAKKAYKAALEKWLSANAGKTEVDYLASTEAPVGTLAKAQALASSTVAARDLNNLVSDANDTYKLFKGVATVTFKGLVVTQVIDSTDYLTTDLQINQAIKKAINSDPVLSKLLKATDGPANTLVVTSLIDGEQVNSTSDLTVAITQGTLTADETTAATAKWNLATSALAGTAATDDYVAQYAIDKANAAEIKGTDSNQATDSTHNLGAGNDVLVLSTNHDNAQSATTNATSSNETVVYGATAFGDDVIVNFNFGTGSGPDSDPLVAGAGEDKFDFRALGKNVHIATGVTAANTTEATAVTNFNATAFNLNNNESAINNVVILVDSVNLGFGTVYQVIDAANNGTNTAVKMGTIDLADSLWADLSKDNFVL